MITFPIELRQRAEQLLLSIKARNMKLATAESCTGGLLSALITEIPGSADAFTHGFVTYCNTAKCEMIGVKESLIKSHGAVSEEVARAMAEGALKTAKADLAVSITGIAGPTGATAGKPVGTLHLACARKGHSTIHMKQHFSGDRALVRMQAVAAALELVQRQLNH